MGAQLVDVVVDPGSKNERPYVHPGDDPGVVDIRLESELGGSSDLRIASLVPSNPPQRIGTHVVEVYVLMSADHWDGLGTDPDFNRLPAGEHLVTRSNAFEVVPRNENVED